MAVVAVLQSYIQHLFVPVGELIGRPFEPQQSDKGYHGHAEKCGALSVEVVLRQVGVLAELVDIQFGVQVGPDIVQYLRKPFPIPHHRYRLSLSESILSFVCL